MRNAHKPGEPISIIERCADVAADALSDLTRANGYLSSRLLSADVAVTLWRQRAEVAEKKLADRERDDTATAHEEDSAELAAVIALLDQIGAPRVQDTHTLSPAARLSAYLDQRAEAVRTSAEENAAEWASDVYVQRGLTLALAAVGHAWHQRGER